MVQLDGWVPCTVKQCIVAAGAWMIGGLLAHVFSSPSNDTDSTQRGWTTLLYITCREVSDWQEAGVTWHSTRSIAMSTTSLPNSD